jgi:hypothetical protein
MESGMNGLIWSVFFAAAICLLCTLHHILLTEILCNRNFKDEAMHEWTGQMFVESHCDDLPEGLIVEPLDPLSGFASGED